MEADMTVIDTIALILVIVGGLNIGSVGVFNVDFISAMFGGAGAVFARVMYALIGLGALWSITLLFKEKIPASDHYHNR